MEEIIPHASLASNEELYLGIFQGLGDMFGSVYNTSTRIRICSVLGVLARNNAELSSAVSLCSDLNSYSTGALDLPDFDRRRHAINEICSERCSQYSAQQWRPILQNLIYFMKSSEDFDIGMNARVALNSAISMLGTEIKRVQLITDILVPALRNGARSDSEQARKNCVEVMAKVVRCYTELQETNDLTCLLMNNDEEASIFNNIFHVQQHRRIRALRRLASDELTSSLRSKNVSQFLVPLLEHLIFDRDDDSKAGDLASEAVITLGALSYRLEWSQARALLRRYAAFISSKSGFEKTTFRLLAVLIDATLAASRLKESNAIENTEAQLVHYPLETTISRKKKLSEDLIANILPSLTSYLHEKDEAVVSLRMPVAVSIAKILMALPEDETSQRLPPVLTDICHVLRSKAVESRDLVRQTLAEIAQVVGAKYFGFIVKELQGALTKGYQIHVLSFTVHTLLVEATPSFEPGDLDYCLADLANVIIDDIFGATGSEKDAEEYTGKSKEIKSRKSFDSMELLASRASIPCLGMLVQPLQTLLRERIDLKTVRKADELLRRLAAGLMKNEEAQSQQSLVFCYELLKRAYTDSSRDKNVRQSTQNRFLVNLKGKKASHHVARGSSYGFKLVCFAFDLVRALLIKFEGLKTPANIAGFLPALGDAMLQAQEEVRISAMRLLAAIIKVPLPGLDKDGAVYLGEAINIVKTAISFSGDSPQAALKLITAYVRERPDVAIKDSDIAQLLKTIKTELDRAESQGLVFNFLKAVLGRVIVIPEVYEFMDAVATMMVTHMSRETRMMARAAYLQFLLNYPQGAKRLNKQIAFLRSNLQYQHIEGRQAILEALHLLLPRVDQDLQQEIVGTFFNPLVMMLVNDESSECRKMASLLLASLFKTADTRRAEQLNGEIGKWLAQRDNALLNRTALQVWGVLMDSAPEQAQKKLPHLRTTIASMIQNELDNHDETSWEVLYYALQLIGKILKEFRSVALDAQSKELWTLVLRSISYPHKWIKTSSASLLEQELSDFANRVKQVDAPSWPIIGEHGLKMDKGEFVLLTRRMLRSMYTPDLSAELADALLRNLVILAQIDQDSVEQIQNGHPTVSDAEDEVDQEEVEQPEDGEPGADNELAESDSVLRLIFRNISVMIRKEAPHNKASALILRESALRLCATLCNGLPVKVLEPYLQNIMQPLYNLVDPNIPTPFSTDEAFKETWKDNVSSAREILEQLQGRIGTTEFLKQSSQIQARVRERRNERQAKRKLGAVSAPERTGKEKQKKGERQKERRKEKAMEYRERRRGW